MLQGRFEWGVACAMAAVVAVIGGWYATQGWTGHEREATPVRHVLPAAKKLGPAAVPRARLSTDARSSSTAWYRFVAVRGDSWLQVRSSSRSGRVLFEGELARGKAVRFRTGPLWVRFGAATNLNLRIAGAASALPRFGTFDAFVTRQGVHPDRVFHPDAPQATAAQSP